MKSLTDVTNPVQKVNIIRNIIPEDGAFPNNGLLPLLLYRQACQVESDDIIRELLDTNRWTNTWVDAIYSDHHFHSTAHEVLVALEGTARVQFGGPNGVVLDFEKGDVVVIPAGVSHCQVDSTPDFRCMGAYPEGQSYDIHYGKPADRPLLDENIRKVPPPEADPIYGGDGPLVKNWLSQREQTTDML